MGRNEYKDKDGEGGRARKGPKMGSKTWSVVTGTKIGIRMGTKIKTPPTTK